MAIGIVDASLVWEDFYVSILRYCVHVFCKESEMHVNNKTFCIAHLKWKVAAHWDVFHTRYNYLSGAPDE